jgi:hypothetical protein
MEDLEITTVEENVINIKDKYSEDNFNLYKTVNTFNRFLMDENIINNIIYRTDDIITTAYPKTGNVWLEHIILSILSKDLKIKLHPEYWNTYNKDTDYGKFSLNYLSALEYSKYKLLEPPMVEEKLEDFNTYKHRRLVKAILPYNGIYNPEIIDNICKNQKRIIIQRNPVDSFISSFFFFTNSIRKTNISMKFWLNAWLQGYTYYGSYFEYYNDWDKIYKKYPDQILWLNYEDLKDDLSGGIKKISEFIDVELTEKELEKITFECTFNNMKKTCTDNDPNYNNHLRKGIIGDWKNYFDQEMLDKFNKKLVEYNYPTYEF